MFSSDHRSLYKNVGPTAWRVAYFRAQTDIPYATDIFNELNTIIKPADPTVIEYMDSAKTSALAPQFEARYKLINRLIAANPANQILELAAGLSPRGLELTDNHPRLQYIETDLPEMINNTRTLYNNLIKNGRLKPRQNLHFAIADALDQDQLFDVAKIFSPQPMTIVNEGLLRYLNFDQKAMVARNVQALLKKHGGTWITSDITLKKILNHEGERADNRRRIKAISGIDVEANCFASEADAKKFFEQLGFSVERHPFTEVIDDLVSPQKLNIDRQTALDIIGWAVVFVMRLK